MSSWIVIGISGVTNGGKTTLAKNLADRLPTTTRIIAQDDYFQPIDYPGHIPVPEVPNQLNWDIISCVDMDKMHADISNILLNPPSDNVNQPVLILEGFLLFDDDRISSVCDKKYFLYLDYEECRKRRSGRTYVPPDLPGNFEHCVWPMYEQYLKRIKSDKQGITYVDGAATDSEQIFTDAYNEISKLINK